MIYYITGWNAETQWLSKETWNAFARYEDAEKEVQSLRKKYPETDWRVVESEACL